MIYQKFPSVPYRCCCVKMTSKHLNVNFMISLFTAEFPVTSNIWSTWKEFEPFFMHPRFWVMSPEQRCWRWYFIIHWCTIMTIIFLIGVQHGWWWHRTRSSCSISREQGALLGWFLHINKGVLHLKGPATIKLWHRWLEWRKFRPPAARQVTGEVQPSSIRNAFGNLCFFFQPLFFGCGLDVSSKFQVAQVRTNSNGKN